MAHKIYTATGVVIDDQTDDPVEGRRMLDVRRCWLPAFDMRPASLFEGVSQRLSISVTTTDDATSNRINSGGGEKRHCRFYQTST